MKILAIGDIHGSSFWEKIIPKVKEYNKIIFIGDYWDSFNINFVEQQKNFLKIIEFKKANPRKVELLLGNHDEANYLYGSYCSGFQELHQYDIYYLFKEHYNLFKIAYQKEEFLFTHAGLSNSFKNKYFKRSKNYAKSLNKLYKENPYAFNFLQKDRSGCGEHIEQSPIWIRPKSLSSDLPLDLFQVFGHTTVKSIEVNNKYALIDSNQNSEFLNIDTERKQIKVIKL